MADKVMGMLGLAKRARCLVSGEEKVLDTVRSRKSGAVILARDASDNTKKKFHDKCSYYGIRVFEYGTKETIGHAVVSLTDRNFAESIVRLLS